MKNTTSNTLFQYWDEVRANRPAPHRFEIEPAQIASILPETFILERADEHTYQFRLAGTRICQNFGRELRGSNLLEGWSVQDRITLERQLSAITKQSAVGEFTIEASDIHQRPVSFEMLVLPLAQYNGRIDRLLGCISTLEEQDWLGTSRLMRKRLLSHELQWPNGRPTFGNRNLATPSVRLPNVRNARIVRTERTQLRVYDGGLAHTEPRKV
jgi:hypothetical protein